MSQHETCILTLQADELDGVHAPWAKSLRDLLQQQPAPLEGLLPGSRVRYFRVMPDCLHVMPLALRYTDTEFTAWRSGYYLAMKRQLLHLYGLTHNLRTPITSIRSRAELMAHQLTSATVDPMADRMTQGLEKIQTAADDIESQLKIQERLFSWMLEPFEKGPFLLHDVIDVLLAYMRTDLFFKKDVTVDVQLADRSPVLRFPPGILAASLLFIIQQFTDVLRDVSHPCMTIRTELLETACVLELGRSGPPIASLYETEGLHGSLPPVLSAGLWFATHYHATLVITENAMDHVCLQMQVPLKP